MNPQHNHLRPRFQAKTTQSSWLQILCLMLLTGLAIAQTIKIRSVTRRMQAWTMTFVTRTISALRAIFLPVGLAKAVLSMVILMITFSLPVFSQNTVVSNVVAQQRPGTGLVDITYDLTATTATVAISLRVSSDAAATFSVPVTSLSGAIGTGVTAGVGKRITWNAGADWPEKWSDAMRFEISAEDGIIIAPSIITQPATQKITGGTTATLAVTVGGSIPITYQWYQGEVGTTTTPVGTNAASFTTPALTDTTSYWVRVSNSAGSVNSSGATIFCSPTITTQPASQTITSGNTATLTVTALGPTPLTYQWYRGFVGNTILPVGTNSASFTTPALTNTSSYWVQVSNSIGNVNSALATISCSPAITTQPASQTINGGNTATLTVTALGPTPLTYQWYQGEVGTTTTPVGTNAASFTTPALTDTTSYWVRVSNSAGSVNSSGATITCSPVITTQPASQTIMSGSTATLTVTASGSTPLTYRWYQGFVGNTNLPVGISSASFTTPALTATTSYWVRVSNSLGSVNSIHATIACSPAITTQPASQTINGGNTATLTVTALGPTPLTYQWYQGAQGTTTTPVGTNSASFTTPALTTTTSYWVRVSNSVGSVDSEQATITCSLAITKQPASQTITSGNTATLTVTALGPNPLTYQWYRGAVGTTTTPVGTNAASFTTPALTATTSYWVRVSNSLGSVNSAQATITCSPAITTQPASQTINGGNTATLTVTALGPTPLTYQWYQGEVGTTTTPVGTNAASFTTPALTDTTSYWVRVSNSAGSVNSSGATISIRPSIYTQPGLKTVASGSTAILSITAFGSPLTYQWYQGAVGTTTTPVGTNSYTFTTPALTTTTSYWVRVSNSVGSVDSEQATVTCSPTITKQPESQAIASGNTATLTVTASGSTPLTYQWYKGAVGETSTPVGTNSASFTTPALTSSSGIYWYWVRVSNAVGSVDSVLAVITTSPAIITKQPASQTIVSGNTATLTVTALGPTPLTYQWYRFAFFPEAPTPVGTNSATFTTPALTNSTSYFVRVSNTAGSVDSENATIRCSPSISAQPASQTIAAGGTVMLSVEASGSTPLTYQWYQGAVGTKSVPVGTNSASFTTPALTDTTSYWVRVSNAFESVNSASAVISCSPNITRQPASQTIAAGGIATLRVVASGSTPLTYQWYQGAEGTTTTPVGTNAASYTTPALTATTSFWVKVSNSSGGVNSTSAMVKVIIPADVILIPAGAFTMGRTSGDTDSDAPPVTVTVSGFYMGKNEVTKASWDDVRTWAIANGYTDLATGAGKASNHPVQSVSWWDVIKWCNASSEIEGLTPCYTVSGSVMKTGTTAPTVNWTANGYRLPTEAEWEKAARGGVGGKRFPWGTDTISHSQANFFNVGDESYQTGTTGPHPSYYDGTEPYTSPVGSFAANGYGLNDMAGNVWEWCWDWYGPSTYVNGSTNPRGDALGSNRVFRGSGWGSFAIACRAADRNGSNPTNQNSNVGFRIARSSVP